MPWGLPRLPTRSVPPLNLARQLLSCSCRMPIRLAPLRLLDSMVAPLRLVDSMVVPLLLEHLRRVDRLVPLPHCLSERLRKPPPNDSWGRRSRPVKWWPWILSAHRPLRWQTEDRWWPWIPSLPPLRGHWELLRREEHPGSLQSLLNWRPILGVPPPHHLQPLLRTRWCHPVLLPETIPLAYLAEDPSLLPNPHHCPPPLRNGDNLTCHLRGPALGASPPWAHLLPCIPEECSPAQRRHPLRRRSRPRTIRGTTCSAPQPLPPPPLQVQPPLAQFQARTTTSSAPPSSPRGKRTNPRAARKSSKNLKNKSARKNPQNAKRENCPLAENGTTLRFSLLHLV
mmetsp:Transcript_1544/g.2757  ORF Transcript_1544/g.2757 Transcript_1544/m.2757 type:complete len:340 (-) Transcript_1544:1308-2327(-)